MPNGGCSFDLVRCIFNRGKERLFTDGEWAYLAPNIMELPLFTFALCLLAFGHAASFSRIPICYLSLLVIVV